MDRDVVDSVVEHGDDFSTWRRAIGARKAMTTEQIPMSVEWPRFDLPRRNMRTLMLSWNISDSESVRVAFGDLLDEDGDALSILPYSRSKVEHRRIQWIHRNSSGNGYYVMLHYDATGEWPVQPVPKELQQSASKFVDRLLTVEGLSIAQCRAEFEYTNGGNYDTVFPLPFELGPPGEVAWPIDEIQGIRGVKRNEENRDVEEYGFTLDRDSHESVWLLLRFDLSSHPMEDVTQRAFDTAIRIASEFVTKSRG